MPSLNDQLVAGWGTQPVAASSSSSAVNSPKSGGSSSAAATKTARRIKRTTTNLNGGGSGGVGSSSAQHSERSTPQPGDAAERSTPRVRKRPRGTDAAGNEVPSKYAPPDLKLSLLGGLQSQIVQLLQTVALPLLHPEIYSITGVPRPRGVLLHGVPGGGKTRLVHCLAGELGLPFLSISAPSVVSGMSGESEKMLRETFEEAKKLAPCLLFLDEVDAITPKRENAQREMEKRIVAQLLTCMDDLASSPAPVVVIGATNRPDSLDTALRRAGRFDHEIEMGVPTVEGREEILRVLCTNLRVASEIDFRWLAKSTPGYVGADLTSLTTEAGVIAVKRIFEDIGTGKLVLPEDEPIAADDDGRQDAMAIDADMDADASNPAGLPQTIELAPDAVPPPSVGDMTGIISQTNAAAPAYDGPFSTLSTDLREAPIARFLINHPHPLTAVQLSSLSLQPSDFVAALKVVQPSAKREGFATVPDVQWSDVGALSQIRVELNKAIVWPIQYPEVYKSFGVEAPSGVLLWGPPGCGKTLLAKAVANQSRANFISVKGPELLNKYVGESERAVRQVFARARTSSPCIIFFDELDALVPSRDDSMSEASARVVNTLLTELDGLDTRKAVYVIGATNRPDMIDRAILRPGRLDKSLYVDLPSPSERVEILRTHTKKTPIDQASWSGIDAIVGSDKCDGFSGADLAALVREAATLALRGALERVGAFNEQDQPDGIGAAVAAASSSSSAANDDAPVQVTVEHFELASQKTKPSVNREQRLNYESLRAKYEGVATQDGIPATTKGKRSREDRKAEQAAAAAAAIAGSQKAKEGNAMA